MKWKRKAKPKKIERFCDPALCEHCTYMGEGDFICDFQGPGLDLMTFVIEDWEPTGYFMHCLRGG